MKINSEELSQYIQAILRGINEGLSQEIITNGESESFSLTSPVKFQLAITNSKEANGEVRIYVAGIHGSKSSEENVHIEFEASDQFTTLLHFGDRAITLWEKFSEKERQELRTAFVGALSLIAMNKKTSSQSSTQSIQ